MKQKFSLSWKSSVQPRKQRKYIANAPLHIRSKFVSSHLSKELHKKYGKRSMTLRKGDKIKILRGSHKGHTGKVERVDLRKGLVYIAGVERSRKEGTKVFPGVHPSNLLIIELFVDDKKRIKAKANPKANPKEKASK